MTILFTCPHCGTQTDVYNEYAGQSGPCAVCGKPITVPYPGGASAKPATSKPGKDNQPPVRRRWPWRTFATIALVAIAVLSGFGIIVAILVSLVFPALSAARSVALQDQSAANMQAIVAAMLQYQDDYGSLPPAYIADDEGKPLHSWRVLLLPYLGHQHVYDRYDFSQPWDSPQNINLQYSMPAVYVSPADPDAKSSWESSYMVVSGPLTAFPTDGSISTDQISDGLQDTIAIVESRASGVSWLDPTDLNANRMRCEINGRPGVEISSKHEGGALVATLDGQTHFLADHTPPEYVRAMTTIQRGDEVPWLLIE